MDQQRRRRPLDSLDRSIDMGKVVVRRFRDKAVELNKKARKVITK